MDQQPSAADDAKLRRLNPLPLLDRASSATLPHELTPLIGRETDVAHLAALLGDEDVRCLTLVGPGGVGKTRLALAVARALGGRFADGVVFVPLASVRDPRLVGAMVAYALDVRETAERPMIDRLRTHLGERAVLLVLDNFEHVNAAAPLVPDLLVACPRLKVLVASRARLGVTGEREVRVAPLGLPDPAAVPSPERLAESAAVRLFVERARAVQSEFRLTVANGAAVSEICQRLDGVPLAIELAAAWSAILPPPALLARLAPRLPMLTGGPRDSPPRLRTMRDAIVWSYDLLTDEEQALFRRLSVFVGGFSLEAADAVGRSEKRAASSEDTPSSASLLVSRSSLLDLLAALVDKSLLQQEPGPDGEPRFGMLDTIAEYAAEALTVSGEEQRARAAHAAWCLALAERAESELTGRAQAEWLRCLETELGNVRAALAWLVAHGDVVPALRLAGTLSHFWQIHGHLREGRQWLDDLLERTADCREAARPRAKAWYGAGRLAYFQEDKTRAEACYRQSLALYREVGDQQGVADVLSGLGFLAFREGDTSRAEALYEESLERYRAAPDRRGVAMVLDHLGVIATHNDDPVSAIAFLKESLLLSREREDRWQQAVTLANLGVVLMHRDDVPGATRCFEECLALARLVGSDRLAAYAHAYLALIAQERGDLARALTLYAEGLALCRGLDGQLPTPRCVEGLAAAAASFGEYGRAAPLRGGRCDAAPHWLDHVPRRPRHHRPRN